MPWIASLATELRITTLDLNVWISIGEALLCGGACLLFGLWIARSVGLLRSGAPLGEVLGVGLATGLLVSAAWWAAVASGGRSSFTPAALGFVLSIGLSLANQARRKVDIGPAGIAPEVDRVRSSVSTGLPAKRVVGGTLLAACGFVVVVGLLYGATMAPSPRDGVQPVEGPDEVLYAVLGRDLAATGTEATYSPSGFADPPGLPTQTWYHWGELWLSAAAISLLGAAPMSARFFIVLPLVLLAAALMTGVLVRRVTGANSQRAFQFGFLAALFLAPVPLIAGPTFSSWAAGMIFGVTVYGLAAVAAPIAMYSMAVLDTRQPTWPLACFIGSAAALLLPTHLVIAVLGLIGGATVGAIRIVRSVRATSHLPSTSTLRRRALAWAILAVLATVIWGALTDHGISSSALQASVSAFNETWRDSLVIVALGAGTFLAIPVAALMAGRDQRPVADIYVGVIVLLLVGAIVWGAWLGDFNTFYVFFGGIALFATPVAAVAAWTLRERLARSGGRPAAVALVVLIVAQLEWGVITAAPRLQLYGPRGYGPIPIKVLDAIRALPNEARLAYACRPFEEATYLDPQLLSIDLHTGHRIAAMCFQADVDSTLVGATTNPRLPSASFLRAPQRALYPDPDARPSAGDVADFLQAHGIDYIYADGLHPNTLVPGAQVVARSQDAELLRISR